MTFVVLVKTA